MNKIKINEEKIERYGRMRLAFIKEHEKNLYTELLFSGRLEEYLCKVHEEVRERIWEYTQQMAKVQGINEELKASDPMMWAGNMNAIKTQAEEAETRFTWGK